MAGENKRGRMLCRISVCLVVKGVIVVGEGSFGGEKSSWL